LLMRVRSRQTLVGARAVFVAWAGRVTFIRWWRSPMPCAGAATTCAGRRAQTGASE
jgi:hypothetical protein